MKQQYLLFGAIAGICAVAILGFLVFNAEQNGFSPVGTVAGNSGSSVLSVKKTPAASAKVLFSEIFPNPLGSDTGKEFIKLYNAGASDADLKDWSIQISKNDPDIRDTLVRIGSQTSDISLIRTNTSYMVGFSGNTTGVDISRKAQLPNSTSTYFLVDPDNVVRDSVEVGTMQDDEIFKP